MASAYISIIVPIYNVKPYLRKCLDSLKSQTMEEIEVILIDDGSTDGSGEIAEDYCCDSRFRCIHTGNRGLSAARNCGIDEAKADWLMFVDGDDWVDNVFCEIPYRTAIKNNADLIIFGLYTVKRGKIKKERDIQVREKEIDEYVAYEFGKDYAWNKLYKKSLFHTIRYPVGRVFEDIATTHKLIHEANRIVMLTNQLYYYCDWKNSITHTHSVKNKEDALMSAIEKYNNLVSYGYSKEKLNDLLCAGAIGYLSVCKPSEERLYQKAKEIVKSVEGIPDSLTLHQKVALSAWRIDKRLFYLLSILDGRMR